MPLLRYLLNELMDEDGDGVPDQRGIPRTPGMSLGDPSSDERLDDFTGIDQPELDQFEEEDFDASPLDQFLERMSVGGVPQGLARPRGFGQGLLSGIAQGAVGRGQRVGERRKKFETSQTQRAAERDKANLQATRDYNKERAAGTRDAVRGSRAERAKQVEYERANPKPTPQQLEAMPWLSRIADENGRVRRADLLSDDPAAAGQKEKRRQFENDRDYNLRVRAEGRQAAKDAREVTGAGKPPTVDEKRAAAFAERGRKAISKRDFVDLEDRIVKGGNLAQIGLIGPRMWQNDDQKKYRQGVESFALAFLRQESMASIKDEEFDQVYRTFFAQPGENEETIQGKREAREAALLGQEQQARGAGGTQPTPPIPATWKKVN